MNNVRVSRFTPGFRILAASVCLFFLHDIIFPEIQAAAQTAIPTNLIMPSTSYLPPAIKAIHINPQSPLNIDFIIDSADQSSMNQQDVKRLIQYFLATLTTPEKDLWVNLSPYEANRIIAPQFGETAAGRELLDQDNMLKQLAASLTYPESKTGKIFWDRVYEKARVIYGTTAVPIDTFQRVWIMPEKAVVYEYEGTAFVSESHLKVLLEDDYKALKNSQKNIPESTQKLPSEQVQQVNNLSATITREIILPEIEKEINEGKNFVPLRQVFNALILATWFKKKLHQHILSHSYVDRKKIKGIEDTSGQTAEKIYEHYMKVLNEGVYNYVRQDFDNVSQSVVPRQYFSGGFTAGDSDKWLSIRKISKFVIPVVDFLFKKGGKYFIAKIELFLQGPHGPLKFTAPNAVSTNWLSGVLAGPMLTMATLNSSVSSGAVLVARIKVLEGAELLTFYITKFKKIVANSLPAPLLVFLVGPAEKIKAPEILENTRGIENAGIYLIDDGKINIINAKGKIGPEVSSSAVLAGGLVLVAGNDESVHYLDASRVNKKTGRSWKDQLAGYLSHKADFAGGPPDPLTASSATKENVGGVDLDLEDKMEVRGAFDDSDGRSTLFSDNFLENVQGLDFQILEFKPIVNPPVFLPEFVKQ